MFNNIEKLIRGCYKLEIEEERYGNGLLLGLDYLAWNKKSVIADLIDRATSSGDTDAMDSFFTLEKLAKEYPCFLFVRANTLSEGLTLLDEKSKLWIDLDDNKKDEILDMLESILENGENDLI